MFRIFCFLTFQSFSSNVIFSSGRKIMKSKTTFVNFLSYILLLQNHVSCRLSVWKVLCLFFYICRTSLYIKRCFTDSMFLSWSRFSCFYFECSASYCLHMIYTLPKLTIINITVDSSIHFYRWSCGLMYMWSYLNYSFIRIQFFLKRIIRIMVIVDYWTKQIM